MKFPDDENGDALRRLQANGDDLTLPRDIDFTVVFASHDAAENFANRIRGFGFKVFVEMTEAEEGMPWDARVVNNMIPSHQAIGEFEDWLESIAIPLGGRNDGWGCIAQNGL